jgi:ribonuclease PH
MQNNRMIRRNPMEEPIAAVSVGIVNGVELLDLCYEEDSQAQVDMNVIMTASGKFVEVQGTGEARPFGADELGRLLKLAKKGIDELIEAQKAVLAA